MKYTLLVFLIWCINMASQSEAQPMTDIFIYDLDLDSKKVTNGYNLTDRSGYDNQPFFSKNGKQLYFTSLRNDQTDAYTYDFETEQLAPLRSTKESEYSPTPMPGGKSVSVVRVEADSTQRLWRFPNSGETPQLISTEIKPVGYHTWPRSGLTAMFVLGQPNTLILYNVKSQKVDTITHNVGRSLHSYKGDIYYVHKSSVDSWNIKKYNIGTAREEFVAKTLPNREDFVVTSTGKVLMADKKTLYLLESGAWQQLHRFTNVGYTQYNRVAVSKDEKKLAIVGVKD